MDFRIFHDFLRSKRQVIDVRILTTPIEPLREVNDFRIFLDIMRAIRQFTDFRNFTISWEL